MELLNSLLNALPGAIAQGMIWGILSIGVYLTYKILNTSDLTVDGSIATGGAVCVMLLRASVNPWLAMLISVLAGMVAGFMTGMLHTKFGIPTILSGILTQLALYSVNLRILENKSNQAISVDKYSLLVSQRHVRELSWGNPIILLAVVILLSIATLYWFFGTEKGCAIRAVGANPNMARAQGVNTNSAVVLGLMLSNGLVALAGALLAQYQGAADVGMGRGAIVIGLAACIVGEVVFGKLYFNFSLALLSTVFGSIIYYAVIQIVLMLGLNTNDLKLFSALIVALFLAVPYWKSKMHHSAIAGKD